MQASYVVFSLESGNSASNRIVEIRIFVNSLVRGGNRCRVVATWSPNKASGSFGCLDSLLSLMSLRLANIAISTSDAESLDFLGAATGSPYIVFIWTSGV